LQLVSLIHFFVSEAASFLHQPRRGGFIEKALAEASAFFCERAPK